MTLFKQASFLQVGSQPQSQSKQPATLGKTLLLSLCIGLSSCTTIALATVDAVGTVAAAGIKTTAKVAVATVETAADVAVAGKRATVYVGTAVAGAMATQAANSAAQSAQQAAYTSQTATQTSPPPNYQMSANAAPTYQRYYQYSIYSIDPHRPTDASIELPHHRAQNTDTEYPWH